MDPIARAERAVRYDGYAGTAEALDPQIMALASAPVKGCDDIKVLAWIGHCQMQLANDEAADTGVTQRAFYLSRNTLFRVANEFGVLEWPACTGEEPVTEPAAHSPQKVCGRPAWWSRAITYEEG